MMIIKLTQPAVLNIHSSLYSLYTVFILLLLYVVIKLIARMAYTEKGTSVILDLHRGNKGSLFIETNVLFAWSYIDT